MSRNRHANEALKEAKVAHEQRLADPYGTDESALRMADLALAERLRLLEKLVPDRTCPVCLDYREVWKVRVDGRLAICVRCFGAAGSRVKLPHKRAPWPLTADGRFWDVDGKALRYARMALGLSLEVFGSKCGWSKSRQRALEVPGVRPLKYGVGLRIQQNLEIYGLRP